MSKLPVVSGRQAVNAFQKMGYVLDHQRGSQQEATEKLKNSIESFGAGRALLPVLPQLGR